MEPQAQVEAGPQTRTTPKPSLGRIVLYTFPKGVDHEFTKQAGQSSQVPAIVVGVWSDTCVNLRVFTDGSQPLPCITSVSLKGEHSGDGNFWEWPPRV